MKNENYLKILSAAALLISKSQKDVNDFLFSLQEDLKRIVPVKAEWKTDELPVFNQKEFEDWCCTTIVLILLKSGEVTTGFCRKDTDTAEVSWYTACSEQWNITTKVIGWKHLIY